MKITMLVVAATAALGLSTAHGHESSLAGNTKPMKPDGHAPIGVMGDHLHKQNEWMISYRYMEMRMEDNLRGSNNIAPAEIASQVANPFGPPSTVRVVPLKMTTKMHMLGMMYAPSDNLTLMLMANHLDKSMDHQTYMGMMGTSELGQFTTRSSGFGDTNLSALWGLLNTGNHRVHLNLGLSLPTGSIDEEDDVLTPMNTRPRLRMPYAMQLGSGTYDLEPGITYRGHQDRIGWGAQYIATLRLGENDEDYSLGDKHRLTGWGSYRVADWASISLRLSYQDEDSIDGTDPIVTAPVTTANPDNYGGERLDMAVGVNLVGQEAGLRGHRLALEYQSTLDQDANGVQMEMESMVILGYQFAF